VPSGPGQFGGPSRRASEGPPYPLSQLAKLPATSDAAARRVLNGYYLTNAGLAELQGLLPSGSFDVNVL
jgi:hypothetical protein